jgi:hypothetical protein
MKMKGSENDIITSAIAADVSEHGEASIERINKSLLKYSISADPGVLRARIKDMSNDDSGKKNG